MRGLLVGALLATAAWTGYWWFGASKLEGAVTQWIADNPKAGVSISDATVQGIPNRWDLTLTDLRLDLSAQSLRWQTPFAQVFAMTWKPWHVIAALPTGQTITYMDQTLSLNSSQMRADVIVHPSATLALQEVIADSADLELISNAGWRIGLGKLLASLREDPTTANRYRVGLRLSDLIPDTSLTAALAQTGLPARMDEAFLDAHLTLSAPLDAGTAKTMPFATVIDLDEARLTWADLQVVAKGQITPDAQGFAAGSIQITLNGWEKLPPLLVALGMVQPGMQQPITGMLTGMANKDGDPKGLEMTLLAKDGQLTLDALPLGPAPQMQPLVN